MDRYHRQMLLPNWGEEGQRRLQASHALIVGCGALGCAASDLLARAGVGRLTIVDRDVVELTNLQRQCLFTEADARDGTPKAVAAASRLGAVNAEVELVAEVTDFGPDNAARLAGLDDRPPTVLVDGTDNLETRFVMNDLAVREGIPYVYAGAVSTGGMCMVVRPDGPCLRCLFPDPPEPGVLPTCDTSGVLGPLIAIVGGIEATEAIKIMLGQSERVSRTLLEFDLWENRRHRLDLSGAKRDDCPCCGRREFEFLEGRRSSKSISLCGRNAVQIAPSSGTTIDLERLQSRLEPHGRVVRSEHLLRATIEPYELTVFRDARVIVHGTPDPEVARSVHARYIGS